MSESADVPVAVLSSRSALDLAINTWVPGVVASSVPDLATVIDLTRDGGVVLVDLADARRVPLLEQLRERDAGSRIVVMAPDGTIVAPGLADLIVSSDATIRELGTAIEEARTVTRPVPPGGPSRAEAGTRRVGSPTGEAPRIDDDAPHATEHDGPQPSDERSRGARSPRSARRRRLFGGRRRDATSGERVSGEDGDAGDRPEGADDAVRAGDGPDPGAGTPPTPEPPLFPPTVAVGPDADGGASAAAEPRASQGTSAPPAVPPPSPVPAVASFDRATAPTAWSILERLSSVIGDGSAMVGVRAAPGPYAVVAASGIAPLEAASGLPPEHPLLSEIDANGGVVTIAELEYSDIALTGMPFDGCPTIIAGRTTLANGVDAVVLLTRSRPFTERDGDVVAAALRNQRAATNALSTGWSLSEQMHLAGAAPTVRVESVSGAWRLLDALYPHLGDGAAALALRTVEPGYAVAAAARAEHSDGAAPFRLSDALWRRFQSTGGRLLLRPREEDAADVADLPFGYHLHVAVLAIGAMDAPSGLVFVGRTQPFEVADLAALQRVIVSGA